MEHYQGEPLRHMGDLPAMAADRYGEETAYIFQGEEMTFNEVEEQSRRVANVLLDHGVEPGERVGLFIPNSLEFPISYFGAIKAGAVPIPLNLRMDPETLVFVLNDAETDYLIGSWLLTDEVLDLADAAEVGTTFVVGGSGEGVVDFEAAIAGASASLDRPPRAYDEVALQPYTSGTTGQPKGVLLTHENLLTAIESLDMAGIAPDPDVTMLLVLPLFHIYGLNAVVGSFTYSGGTLVMQALPEGKAMLEAIEEYDVTDFNGVPAMYTMMWREYRDEPDAYDISSLERLGCAAAPLADETRRTIEEAWNVPMTEGWGMTETAPTGTVEPRHGVRKGAGCVGPAAPNVEIKLVDPETRETKLSTDQLSPFPDEDIDFADTDAVTGEIAIRGPMVFEGYHNRPEQTAAVMDDAGWFYTEDIARVDADGYFWMVDRADDMIIVGGENVYPAEVEDALYEHPAVAEAAVTAAPHEVKGQAPVAFVVLEGGAEVSEEELRRFTLDHVASYAHPRRIFFVEELPRSATQKVQRYKLEAEAKERLPGPLESSEEL